MLMVQLVKVLRHKTDSSQIVMNRPDFSGIIGLPGCRSKRNFAVPVVFLKRASFLWFSTHLNGREMEVDGNVAKVLKR
jgi:hypothetical protein